MSIRLKILDLVSPGSQVEAWTDLVIAVVRTVLTFTAFTGGEW